MTLVFSTVSLTNVHTPVTTTSIMKIKHFLNAPKTPLGTLEGALLHSSAFSPPPQMTGHLSVIVGYFCLFQKFIYMDCFNKKSSLFLSVLSLRFHHVVGHIPL